MHVVLHICDIFCDLSWMDGQTDWPDYS